MTDRRLFWSNGRVAHLSLKGVVEAEVFAAGRKLACTPGGAAIHDAPEGRLERQMRMGDAFVVLDDARASWAFGFAERDGYAGWVSSDDLMEWRAPSHRVAVLHSIGLDAPDIKANTSPVALGFGDRLTVEETRGGWCRHGALWVPARHLASGGTYEDDLIDVARMHLGVPYLWAGNSARGIDCSGLVQIAFHACGLACPGDSDLQEAMPGTTLDDGQPLEPGDLIFWKGHVAMATGPQTMIHANAHHMAVVEEPTIVAFPRIAASAGPITSRLRPELVQLD